MSEYSNVFQFVSISCLGFHQNCFLISWQTIIQLSEWNTATFCDHTHCDNISSMIESSPHYWGIGDCPEFWGKNSDHITNARPGRLNVVNILPVNNFFQATSNQSNIIYSVGLHSDSLNKIRNYSTWQRSFNCKISLKSYKMFLKNLNPIFCLLHTTSTVLPKCKHEYQYKYYWQSFSGNALSIIFGS